MRTETVENRLVLPMYEWIKLNLFPTEQGWNSVEIQEHEIIHLYTFLLTRTISIVVKIQKVLEIICICGNW